ncbi:MAG: biopolymer transport protein ExbD [Halanaerobium sp. 4-GBenrich]|jgi:biopolymer transport protein ExbD|uniref:Biopolymer transport protein ExbD n=1 Tax=Halanaerobium congolense TaxID=54121 RepID=A0A1G6P854_9FIRM|nr:biopolymer transporter ExbD [Halanaerobium congolense]KXS50203.1 MAG: biopolymer transport protein ExbD [Halanaerobium sp. T82-1]ODS50948.1 MAG: biopolymer transport protein ExbD [Halanaerobium sp. 4-GBenrich]OEG63647.1 MAG: biopolymer transporter ExbD [Halanaerobium sp. MDAL1]PUU93388.1 MAG: biopolymer transport protein ExbD [Halanaerobium sp.]PTX17167.1 biopolymer transport protein ExbD [Halanaerobium congolense]
MFKTTLKKKSSINIIPMIDVIFFLLVFFMLFTTFRTTPEGIEMQLPKAVTATEQSSQNFIVQIDEEGNYYYEDQSLALNQIISEAEVANNENNNLTIVISADKNTRYENVVSLMDGMRNVGITRLALAAEKEGS